MTEPSKTVGSKYFNLFVLRRLFNKDHTGRTPPGEKHRYEFHPTVTFITMNALSKAVPTGQGRYASPVVELSLRVMLALVGMLPIETVGEELSLSVNDRTGIYKNLLALAAFVSRYSTNPAPPEV